MLPGGRTVGIVRQGLTADRSAFSKRLWRLGEGPLPGAVLVLTSDEVRLRHSRRALARTSAPAILALERDAVLAGADDPVWRPTSGNAALDLGRELRRLSPGGELPWEKPLSRATVPGDIAPGRRPRAARHPQTRREARPRPAGRLALDIAEGHGRTDGPLGNPGLPAHDPPGGVRPRDPRRRWPPNPHRPGAGDGGPQGPRLRGRGPQALERRANRPRRPLRLAQRDGRQEQAAAQEHRAHRRRPRLHGRAGPPVPDPGDGRRRSSTRPTGPPGASATATPCAPSAPTPSASCGEAP